MGKFIGTWVSPLSLQSTVVSVQEQAGGQTEVSLHEDAALFSIPEHFNNWTRFDMPVLTVYPIVNRFQKVAMKHCWPHALGSTKIVPRDSFNPLEATIALPRIFLNATKSLV